MKALISILLLFPSLIWRAFVLVRLWFWFMVPLGLPRVTIMTAMAVFIISAMFIPTEIKKDLGWEEFAVKYLAHFMAPLVALGIGWLLHVFAA